MDPNHNSVNTHYGTDNLSTRIIKFLKDAGKDIDNLSREDIVAFEEFHIGGRKSTRELAELAGLSKEMKVLDIGCGIGGPARTLAAEFGCNTTGIDLTEEYCLAAEMLTEKVNLSEKANFIQGSALDLPFEDNSFDVVWLQHVGMNIKDKDKLFKEAYRVLKTNGQFAFHEVMKDNGDALEFPVFWAENESISFLETSHVIVQMLIKAGFKKHQWIDVTDQSLKFFQKLATVVEKEGLPLLSFGVIVVKDVPKKIENLTTNLRDKRIKVIQACFKK